MSLNVQRAGKKHTHNIFYLIVEVNGSWSLGEELLVQLLVKHHITALAWVKRPTMRLNAKHHEGMMKSRRAPQLATAVHLFWHMD